MEKIFRFILSDFAWVALGQGIAMVFGLLSLKVYTNLFSEAEYASIALMMALAGWISTALYQPLNQTIFRFRSLSKTSGWEAALYHYVKHYHQQLTSILVVAILVLLVLGHLVDVSQSLLIVVLLGSLLGMSYGVVHGLVSTFMADRNRKAVAFIQGVDGPIRLAGGLLIYFIFVSSVEAASFGIVLAGCVFLVFLVWRYSALFNDVLRAKKNAEQAEHRSELSRYQKKMSVVMFLNASVTNMDKWLLLLLLGVKGLGIYAALYFLAMAITSVMYVFFEMLGFPLIINQTSTDLRRRYQRYLMMAFVFSLLLVLGFAGLFGHQILSFLTTDSIASYNDTFVYLLAACGLINLGRITMVEGQVEKQPHKYWPAYAALLVFFSTWCLALVSGDDVAFAAVGLAIGSLLFVVIVSLLNRQNKSQTASIS